jgi:hypothetical protein
MSGDAKRTESEERFFIGLAAATAMIRERDKLSKRELARRAETSCRRSARAAARGRKLAV